MGNWGYLHPTCIIRVITVFKQKKLETLRILTPQKRRYYEDLYTPA